MTNSTIDSIRFTSCKKRKVEAEFGGGEISSDAGAMLLSEADKMVGLCDRVASIVDDPRMKNKCTHSFQDLFRQRVYGIAFGYEDLNDHIDLRKDTVLLTAVGRDSALASKATLCRFKNRATQKMCWQISQGLLEVFIESHKEPPKELILDFDRTDDPVHGDQMGRFLHGYYDRYCFLPLYIFCGRQLLGAYLRPSNIDPARGAWAALRLLADRFRQKWPDVRIIFRADSGFCRHRMMNWCDKNNIEYIIGIARNNILLEKAQGLIDEARRQFKMTAQKQRLFGKFMYAAGTCKKEHRVIVKAEHLARGLNPLFVVTNSKGDS